MSHIVEITELTVILTAIAIFLAVIAGSLAVLAARKFAGDLGKGFNFLVLGSAVMIVNFLFGLDDHLHLAGVKTLLAHPGWIHGATISLAIVFFLLGFLIIYRTALKVASQ